MKNAILIYQSYDNYFNIGDYIQSIAARQFLIGPLVYLNREKLNEYSGEKVKLIMNGWFMHEQQNWPPSKDIFPCFISFHISSDVKDTLLSPENVEYFKKWEPIGCRDNETLRLLVQKGVKAYFSGCLTLTLGEKYESDERCNKIYFVDPYFEYKKDICSILSYLFVLLLNFNAIAKISGSMFKNRSLKSIIKIASFFKNYRKVFSEKLLEDAVYVRHIVKNSDFNSDAEKFSYAEELINNYAKAKFVVTSRIHCALPCVGFKTPVIYIENKNQPEISFCRLGSLRDFFNIISYNKGEMLSLFCKLQGKIDNNYSFSNKDNHEKYKQALIAACKNFVGGAKDNPRII
jgi:hypothetical protein